MAILYVKVRSWFIREDGQDLAEYALLIGLIALVVVGAVTYLGQGIDGVFRNIADTVAGWFGTGGA